MAMLMKINLNQYLPPPQIWRKVLVCLAALLILYSLYFFLIRTPDKTALEQIKERGYLVVATRNSPTTYYRVKDQAAGLEYDLARAFAEKLGVKLYVVVADTIHDLVQILHEGKVDFIASGMPISATSDGLLRYSRIYQEVKEQIVDLQRVQPRPRTIADLDEPLGVLPTTSHLETVNRLQQQHPNLVYRIEHDLDFADMIQLLLNKKVRYVLATSNELQAIRHRYPSLRIAFSLPDKKGLAWAVLNNRDTSLIDQIDAYLQQIKINGFLTELQERYYGHIKNYDYSGAMLFFKRITRRLPKYEPLFRQAGDRFGIDWRLLAAMSHQESQWNPQATSVTGVRGLMMLTLKTAAQLGVTDRLNPQQSIMGGAEYIAQLKERLPDSITEPDRTWIALAAYNIGYGHVLDARKITLLLNADPDKWINIKRNLPLLRKRQWYKKLRYGYARGNEPVQYVLNIRRYYDILSHIFSEQDADDTSPDTTITVQAPQSARQAPTVSVVLPGGERQ